MDRFHELRVLLAVADTGGFGKAAARLNSSPPAVTRAVAGLEARLGVEVFRRTTRRVQLTDAGRVLAERARLVLVDLDAAESEASGQAVIPTGQLTLTASVTMGRAILAPVVSAFLDAYPRVSARLVLFDRIVNLVDEGIDVGLRVGHLPIRVPFLSALERYGASWWPVQATSRKEDIRGSPLISSSTPLSLSAD